MKTKFTIEEVRNLERIGGFVNKWRGRYISIYKHPKSNQHVVSVGIPLEQWNYPNCDHIICVEPIERFPQIKREESC